MSFLSTTNLLWRWSHGHDVLDTDHAKGQEDTQRLTTKSSLANLIHFAKNPLGNISEGVEDWYDGTTKAERAARQAIEDRKQLLYLKMRMVRYRAVFYNHPANFGTGRDTLSMGSSCDRIG